jgi:hypothetical protein
MLQRSREAEKLCKVPTDNCKDDAAKDGRDDDALRDDATAQNS